LSKNYIKDVFQVLIASENLKRLLWYPPEDILTNTPSPLSPTLPNISDDEELNWRVIDDRILLNSKSDDLVDEPKCRIYFYLGDRNKTDVRIFENQEIIIDVLWHKLFDNDMRIDSISKTIDSLLLNQRITGWGRMQFSDGHVISTPKNYQGYRYIYQVGVMKK
jgi:hypothetical protein